MANNIHVLLTIALVTVIFGGMLFQALALYNVTRRRELRYFNPVFISLLIAFPCVLFAIYLWHYPVVDKAIATITTRAGKGAPLSATNYDDNVNTMRLHSICKTINNLAAADDNIEIYEPNHAVTVTEVGCSCNGTCSTTAQISLETRGGTALTHTTPTCSTTGNTTRQAVTDNAASQLVAGEGLRFDVDNTPDPETDQYQICVTVSYD